ncbi:MAG TPA: NAD(P)H-dependent oxidoreductase [Rhodopila sp.]|nr:NAD(P)H-dependent oxidoreductase [Rhodopila sp.]
MSDSQPIRVLGISGSLRRGSFNTAALRAARELAPAGMAIEIYEGLGEIPPYDDDVRQQQGYPPAVEHLRARLKAADAVLIATPEYNYSVPGMLKNAIDWASRPPEQPFDGKPVAIMGASPGALGTARAQYHLRQIFVFLNGLVLNRPEVMIAQASSRFDADGHLADEKTREFVAALLVALRDWTVRLRR